MIGADCGTFNLITCKKNDAGEHVYKTVTNAFISISLDNDFVYNMMKNAKTPEGKPAVPLILREDKKVAYALGDAAIKFAYTLPSVELRRPMKNGCVNPSEHDGFNILNIMLHSLLDNVTADKEVVYYSVPANAINGDTDADYHTKLLAAIFKAYKSPQGFTVDARPINEALALVYAELASKAFTGIGISCLIPGTKIYTQRGIVNIEDVVVGDKVLTHLGRWRSVNEVITKNFEGISTKLQIQGYSNTVENYKFVDNHELYVNRNGEWKWVGCEELLEGDVVGEPIEKFDVNSTTPLMCLYEKTTNSKPVKKCYEVSGPIQRLIGYFMGDGSCNVEEGCIQFDFTNHEISNIEDVINILKNTFDKNATVIPHGDGCSRVKCYSRALMNWFSKKCYDNDKSKIYPYKLSQLTQNSCINLLAGLIRSDGSVFDGGISFFNTNTKLIYLVKQLFSRLGVAASINYRDPREGGTIDGRTIIGKKDEWVVNTGNSLSINGLAEVINNIHNKNLFPKKLFLEDGFCCGKIQKIENDEYQGVVYDLKVEEDHSFSGPYLTIHNCGAGMVNVCFAVYGAPVFTFAIVNSGDWIDAQVAKATGESVSFVNREKHKIDLSKTPTTLVERAIQTQYRIMIEHTVSNIKKGLETSNRARLEQPIDIVVAGGTATPNGFEQIFKEVVESAQLPIDLGEIIKPKDPVKSVATGCLIAAENAS